MIEGCTSTVVDTEDRSEKGCPMGGSTCNRTSNHNLSASDILDNVVMLLFDETSKNTLAHISYLLAINPDIQLKLQDAIDAFYRENPVRLFPFLWLLCGHACCLFKCCRKPSCMKQLRKLTTLITLYKKVFVSILPQ